VDSIRIRQLRQATIPVSLAVPLRQDWTLDMQAAFASGTLQHASAGGAATGSPGAASLAGLTDVRLRLTGRLRGDALAVTMGANLPSGRTSLTGDQLTALRGLAAPALALGTPAIGSGPGATIGLVSAREVAGWAMAMGGSIEWRGSYQPIAALAAGLSPLTFDPGQVVRLSFGVDRLLGPHRVSLATSLDRYGTDRLFGGSPSTGIDGGARSTIRLGPIISTDVQLQLAVPRAREFVLWSAHRYRTRSRRDSSDVVGTSGAYLDAGWRSAWPLNAASDVIVTGEGRWHSGLAIGQGLATSGVLGFGGTLGVNRRLGNLSVQPFVRGQLGTLRPRVSGTAGTVGYTGFAGGLILVTRF
jgi:hypothetical protein